MQSTHPEIWMPVIGYESSYEVSNHGHVYSKSKGAMMALTVAPSGHKAVHLYRNGRSERRLVHRLVLEAFVGPAPDGHECLHGDGDPGNNFVENLRWGTHSENMLDSVRHGTHPSARKTHCPRGHAYTENNTYLHPRGHRACVECRHAEHRERAQARKVKRRENPRNPRPARNLYWHERDQRWDVRVKVNGKSYYGGRFVNEQDAVNAAAKLRAEVARITS